jgi:hypothetical protein
MAKVYPDIRGLHAQSFGQVKELEVLRALESGLPDDYAVFHSVQWSSLYRGTQRFGEIDTVVLAADGSLAILEVKAGLVEFRDGGVFKQYADRLKDVGMQIRIQYAALRQRLKEANIQTNIVQFLVLPDMEIEQVTVAYPRERIVDRKDMAFFAERVSTALPCGVSNPQKFQSLRYFLSNLFQLSADPSVGMCWLNRAVNQLAEGLATWTMKVQSPNGLYHIQATAGGGKTQLALRLLEDAHAKGCEALYVCFNRPLADQMRGTLANSGQGAIKVATFHELAIGALRQQGVDVVDFAVPKIFARAEQAFCNAIQRASLDLLIIDEGQDLHPRWVSALLRLRKEHSRAYFLQDATQTLFLRDDADVTARSGVDPLAEAVRINCPENFRSPRQIVQVINAFRLADETIIARSPIDGEVPGFHRWEDGDPSGFQTLEKVVQSLLQEGVQPESLALLSYMGRERSFLLQQESVAGLTLRRFSGIYDKQGLPQWTEGRILTETVHRFKGQAAPVVVLCEIDFEHLDAQTRHRLFVGMTRAQWRLECVLSARAERALIDAIGMFVT